MQLFWAEECWCFCHRVDHCNVYWFGKGGYARSRLSLLRPFSIQCDRKGTPVEHSDDLLDSLLPLYLRGLRCIWGFSGYSNDIEKAKRGDAGPKKV